MFCMLVASGNASAALPLPVGSHLIVIAHLTQFSWFGDGDEQSPWVQWWPWITHFLNLH